MWSTHVKLLTGCWYQSCDVIPSVLLGPAGLAPGERATGQRTVCLLRANTNLMQQKIPASILSARMVPGTEMNVALYVEGFLNFKQSLTTK